MAAAPNTWDPLAALALADAANDPETAEVVQLMQLKHNRRLAEMAQTAVAAHRRAVNARLVQSAAAVESATDRIAQASFASFLAQFDDQTARSSKARDEMVASVHRHAACTKDAHAQISRMLTDHDRATHDRLAAHLASVPSIGAELAVPGGKHTPLPPPAGNGDPMQGVERT
ncbi:hypothetical protein AMAG_03308 [Allomyces macrogynus ATCC 38327]|uniref:Uncharacterized protein n=1 Tax=Allomyces macrogynus (strain ATCC 38327) TaxID=578462 RepID=A0A0L0S938_ALLM3|nr:hypothetical protein AMAG_03308 [Allomyces macrogynus ATCC 38327]|eukprot:KNE58951.1 hypothetical protein AMAG_03308 [Allomyces macrogynus ATCC 38327]